MIDIRRLPVSLLLLGAGLVVAACGDAIDPELSSEPTRPVEDDSSEPPESGAACMLSASENQRPLAKDAAVDRCNYGDAWHCLSAQQGWLWVPVRRRPSRGPVSGPGDLPAGTGEHCCVLVGPRQPPRPEGT